MRLLICGDTHGNTDFLRSEIFPAAKRLRASAIIVLGDFGAWEHMPEDRFIDEVADLAAEFGIELFWLHGNHDNWSLAMDTYGHQRTADGFVIMRPGLMYIPQGHAWEWVQIRFRSFGGAYSLDKGGRLKDERRDDLAPGSLWFLDEEPTDAEFEMLLAADSGLKEVVLSHDKPRSSNPGIRLKDKPECYHNQDRLQRALLAHRPHLWLHGHLHHRYTCGVRNGEDGWTEVIGLSCDPQGAIWPWRPTDAWGLLEFGGSQPVTFTFGECAGDSALRRAA